MSAVAPAGELVPGGVRLALGDLSFSEVFDRWSLDPAFAAEFTQVLAGVPFGAFRFELPPLTADTLDRPFEWGCLDAPGLVRRADAVAFAGHFARSPVAAVVEFPNLSGDAVLVVPAPRGDPDAYTHLGAFVRKAPEGQAIEVWRAVASAMRRRLNSRPVWLNTAGAGVPWLHVRLDDAPKYYRHAAYREWGTVRGGV